MTPVRHRPTPGPGVFVTFEGIEGAGKSTQIERLADRLLSVGAEVVKTREPGGTDLGRGLRAVLLRPSATALEPLAELLLYAADRAQHVRETVLPALERGAIVLCDRFLDATLAYQGYGRRLGTEVVLRVHSSPPLDLRPHRTVLLDLDAARGLARARRRNDERGVSRSEGRFEEEALAFHRRVREGYLELARHEPDRIRVVPADGDPDDVHARVGAALEDLLPSLGSTERRP
jgi:dTMP kinase